jgi:lysophospholipase L1-like esterase
MSLASQLGLLASRLGVEFKAVRSEIAAAASSPKPTRRACITFGGGYAGGGAGAFDVQQRLPFQLPVNVTRWRVKVANQTRAGVVMTTPWTLQSIYAGAVAPVTGTARPTASFAATPTQVFAGPAAVPTDGSDFVTPWYTTPLSADVLNQISVAITSVNTGNGETCTTRTSSWSSLSGGTTYAGTIAGSGLGAGTTLLDWRIEYEYVGRELVGLAIGDSIVEGQNGLDGASGAARIVHLHETWPGIMAQRNRTNVVNMAQAGSTTQNWTSLTSRYWTAFDVAGYAPDYATIALGTNDLVANRTLAAIQSDYATVIRNVQSFGIKQIFVCPLIPVAFASGGTQETTRQSLNTWLSGLPLGVEGFLDMDYVIRNPATPNTSLAEAVGTDNTHPYARGYQRMGAVGQVEQNP